jgi:hypothetical protein
MQLFANIHPVTGSQQVNKTEELKVVIASEVFAVSKTVFKHANYS